LSIFLKRSVSTSLIRGNAHTYFPSACMEGLYEAKIALRRSRVGPASKTLTWSVIWTSVGDPDEISGGKKARFCGLHS
jgi:hypothetical protein